MWCFMGLWWSLSLSLSLCLSISLCIPVSVCFSFSLSSPAWWLMVKPLLPEFEGVGLPEVLLLTGKLHIARCIFSYQWLYFLLSSHTLAAGSPSACLSAPFNPHFGRQRSHNNRISREGPCFPLRPHLCLWPPGRWATQLFTSHSSESWIHAYSGHWCVYGGGRKKRGKWKSVFSKAPESCSSGVYFWSTQL